MYVDFNTDALFHQPINPLAAVKTRDFSTASPGVIEQYVAAKMKYLTEHQFFERLHSLEEATIPINELAEALDRDFTRASFHAA